MDQLKEPSCFEFQRLVFGLDSAPFLGQYIFQKSAKENQKDFPFAAETVLQSTYMDDSMDSMVNEDEAVKLVPKLDELWRKDRMQPRRWLPSSKRILAEIAMKDRAKQIDLSVDDLPSVQKLGEIWSASSDQISFSAAPLFENIVLTKRKFSTLFDPLGFVIPFVVSAKILVQQVWVSWIDWDNQLPKNILDKTKKWFAELQDLSNTKIVRCFKRSTIQVMTDQSFHVKMVM